MHLIPAELDVGTEEVEGMAQDVDVSPASMSSTVNLLEGPILCCETANLLISFPWSCP